MFVGIVLLARPVPTSAQDVVSPVVGLLPSDPVEASDPLAVNAFTLASVALDRAQADVSCSGMELHRAGDLLVATGFVGSEEDAHLIADRLTRLAAPLLITTAIKVKPRPFCRLLALAKSGTPAERPRIRFNKPDAMYNDGERLSLVVTIGERGGYLTIDSFDLQNSVVHMAPLPRVKNVPVEPGQSIVIGAGPAGPTPEDQRAYTVSAPFGPGLVVVTVSDRPLFDADRAEVEPAEGYAKDFEQAVRTLRQNASVLLTCASFATKPN